ncbi:MAG: 50S ribosomal protein L6 [Nanoarchaeota archaeon]
MKSKILESLEIPEGISCSILQKEIKCSKEGKELSRIINIPRIELRIEDNKIILNNEKGNKKDMKMLKAEIAHIKNIFRGLQKKFIYKLEACNVHFPMTLKLDGNILHINNFLGEKIARTAKILEGVEIEIKGQKITLSSHDLKLAGQTATNIEKATKIKNRDKRVFQDGIYIVEKPEARK